MPKLKNPLLKFENVPVITWREITRLTSCIAKPVTKIDTYGTEITVKIPKDDEEALFHFAYLTGCSAAEIQGLTWADITINDRIMEFRVNGRRLFLPVHGAEMRSMRDVLEKNKYFNEPPFKILSGFHNPSETFSLMAERFRIGRMVGDKFWPYSADVFRSNIRCLLGQLSASEESISYMLGRKKLPVPYSERAALRICALLRQVVKT